MTPFIASNRDSTYTFANIRNWANRVLFGKSLQVAST